MDSRPPAKTSTGNERTRNGGGTFYGSVNHDTGARFYANFPANDEFAADLRELAVEAQKDEQPSRGATTSEFIRELDKIDENSSKSVGTRKRDSSLKTRTDHSIATGSGPWYKHETTRDVAYRSKSKNGEMFLYAPKGSQEAAFYEDLERKGVTVREERKL